MIEKNLMIKIGKEKGLTNKGFIEKDYLTDLLLYALNVNSKNELIFKGGTALFKFFGLRRFSEDLDFTVKGKTEMKKILHKSIRTIETFDIKLLKKTEKKTYNSLLIKLLLKGPLFNESLLTANSIRIDLNFKTHIKEFKLKQFESKYPDIPIFTALVLDEKEITAEKIRAIISRDKARDVYDLYFLLRAEILPGKKLLNEKLDYYNLKFEKKIFLERLKAKKELWEKELKSLVLDELPEFSLVYKLIEKKIELVEK